jgi:hydrogenase maturation protease
VNPARVRVVGCGNPEAGDDAVGLIAVREARPALEAMPQVDVVEIGAGLRIVDLLLVDAAAVVVVDAVRTPRGARSPGTIVRVEVGEGDPVPEPDPSLSSHGFAITDALGLAAALGEAPRVVLLGVEVEDVTAGHPLSRPVAASLPDLIAAVVREAERLLRP